MVNGMALPPFILLDLVKWIFKCTVLMHLGLRLSEQLSSAHKINAATATALPNGRRRAAHHQKGAQGLAITCFQLRSKHLMIPCHFSWVRYNARAHRMQLSCVSKKQLMLSCCLWCCGKTNNFQFLVIVSHLLLQMSHLRFRKCTFEGVNAHIVFGSYIHVRLQLQPCS